MTSGTYAGTYSSTLQVYKTSATITAAALVATADADAFGVVVLYSGTTLTNAGHVSVSDSGGVGVYFDNIGDFTNTGSIGGDFGVELVSGGTIVNKGTISANHTGVTLDSGVFTNGTSGVILTSGYSGIGVQLSGSVTASNAGLIGVLVSTRPNTGYADTFGVILNGSETFSNTGNIELYHDQNYTGTFTGVSASSGGTLINSGKIQAGGVYYGFREALRTHSGVNPDAVHVVRDQYVGMGVVLSDSTCFNSGVISAHNVGLTADGTSYVENSGGIGAESVGIELIAGTVVNTGAIGAFGSNYNAGIYMLGGTLINSGTIQCTGSYDSYGVYAIGKYLSITNQRKGFIGGLIGVDFTAAAPQTLVNAGTIVSYDGATGFAVSFSDSNVSNLLLLEPGSSFIGEVDGGIGGSSALELGTGTGIGTLSGFGTEIINFPSFTIDAGAKWLLNGSNTLAPFGTLDVIMDNGLLTLGGTTAIYGDVAGTGTLGFGGIDALYFGSAELSVSNLLLSGGVTTLVDPNATSLTFSQNFVTTGGALALSGHLLSLEGPTAFKGGTIEGDGTASDDSVLFTYGSVSLSALTLTGAAFWQDEATATMTGSLTLGSAGGGFGQLNVDPDGGVFDITGNGGITQAVGGTGTIDCVGLFEKTGGTGTSVISATMLDTGTIAVTAGTLDFIGPTTSIGGTVSGAGTIEFGAGQTTLTSRAVLTVSHLDLSGATLTLGKNLTYNGSLAQSAGPIKLSSYTLVLNGAANLTNGAISGTGFLATYGAVSLVNYTINGGAVWQVYGTTTATASITLGNGGGGSGRLAVETGAVYDLTGNGGIVVAPGGSGTVGNFALFEKTGGTGTSIVAAAISDTGTINVTTGTLDFTGASNSFSGKIGGAGAIEFGGGANSILAGAVVNVAAVAIDGASTTVTLGEKLAYGGGLTETSGATLALGSNTLTLSGSNSFAGTIGGTGTIAFTAGQSNFITGSILTVSHVIMAGGGLTISKNLNYSGAFVQNGGPLRVTGNTFVLRGSTNLNGGATTSTGFLATFGPTSLAAYTVNGGAAWQVYGMVTATGYLTLGNGGGGSGRLAVEAGGVYDITGAGGVVVAPGGSGTVGNFALFEKTGGTGISTVAAAFTNSGTIVATSGALDFAGSVSGMGRATIGGAGVLRFDSTVASTETIAFAGTAGGRLALNDPSGSGLGFAGAVTGFGGKDQLDLTTFAFTGTPTIGWSQNGSRGTLTVTDGSKVAKITLFGQYAQAGFGKAKDGGTGTTITYTTPAQVALAPPHHGST